MFGRFLVLLLLVVTGACSSDDGDESAGSSSANSGEVVSSVDDVLVAQLTLVGGPDWLAADSNGLWVRHDSGELTLVDPETNQVVDSADLGDPDLCAGLGAAYDSIWTCGASEVLRVDPESLEVVSRFAVKKQAVQGHLVGGFDRIWVLTSDGGSMVGIDPATNEVATEFELPARCSDVTVGVDALWLPCALDDRVLKVDPSSGEVLLDLAIDNPVSVAVDTDVWVGAAGVTLQLDPTTGEVLAEVAAGAAPDGGVALDEKSVWVRNGEDFLIQVDRQTGARVQQLTAEVTSGGDLLVLDGDVWTTAFDDEVLFRIDPDGSG